MIIQRGAYYTFPVEEPIGKPVVKQGREAARTWLMANPDRAAEVEQALRERLYGC